MFNNNYYSDQLRALQEKQRAEYKSLEQNLHQQYQEQLRSIQNMNNPATLQYNPYNPGQPVPMQQPQQNANADPVANSTAGQQAAQPSPHIQQLAVLGAIKESVDKLVSLYESSMNTGKVPADVETPVKATKTVSK